MKIGGVVYSNSTKIFSLLPIKYRCWYENGMES